MKTSNLKFCEISYRSQWYHKALQLRYRQLRQPLHLTFDREQLSTEWLDYHLAALDSEDVLIACLVLSPNTGEKIKMRQVAVDELWHRQGVGAALVSYSEAFSRSRGYRAMFCHARKPVVPFYEKLGYQISGQPFEEVGIVHMYMEKSL